MKFISEILKFDFTARFSLKISLKIDFIYLFYLSVDATFERG